jgi:hypothetical protein
VWQGWEGLRVRFPANEVMFDFFFFFCSLLVSWLLFALVLLSLLGFVLCSSHASYFYISIFSSFHLLIFSSVDIVIC